MIVVDEVLQQRFPQLDGKPWLQRPARFVLRRLLHERELQEFSAAYPYLQGLDFVEQVLAYFDFSYSIRDVERERIPTEGRVVVIANHPIGSLDGLALIKLVSEIRPDVKAVANELLMAIEPLHPLLLPVNNMGGGTTREKLKNIHRHLASEGALIIFPAGEVSRLRPQGVRDTRWQDGFLRMATHARAPILPIHLDGHNSPVFYSVSMFYKPLATALLVTEMFRQRDRHLPVRVGEMIPYESWNSQHISTQQKVKLLKKHLYRIGRGREPVFRTQPAIALPEGRRELSLGLQQSECLGCTTDGKIIYLHRYQSSSSVIREIGRLREISFRAVGEGTYRRRDIDVYDSYYFHVVLWDPKELEIVGAYRLGDASMLQHEDPGLYTNRLFEYHEGMRRYFDEGLELGRGFVQPKYWGRRSLDYLWYGIGAFLQRYPGYRYLFGAVSISASMPAGARDLLISFYRHYFPAREKLARARHPYIVAPQSENSLKSCGADSVMPVFKGDDYQEDFIRLKRLLADMGVAVPTLYKQYAELCEPDGIRFLAFNIDELFSNCVDGLILVDTQYLLPQKRRRYLADR